MSVKKRFHFTEQENKRKGCTNIYSRDKQMSLCFSDSCGKGGVESGVVPEAFYFTRRVTLEVFHSKTP